MAEKSSSINRYVFLDGIRGVAALFVMTRHTGGFWNFSFDRAYLAVDLFFVLSGFVIAYAYDRRIVDGSISPGKFIVIRLIRLYPIYFLSVLLCIVLLFIKANYSQFLKPISGDVNAIVLLTLLMTPSRLVGVGAIFPLNIPYWSLFFELIVNFIYAFVGRFLTNKLLSILVSICGVILIVVSMARGGLDAGYYWGKLSLVAGFFRALFGISLGLLLYRKSAAFTVPNTRLGPWLAIALVVTILVLPTFGGLDAVFDIFVVFVIFPGCVLLAAKGEASRVDKILLVLGSASYPIYVLHQPLGELFYEVFNHFGVSWIPLRGLIFTLFIVWFSVWLERVYDIPIRRKLTQMAFGFKK